MLDRLLAADQGLSMASVLMQDRSPCDHVTLHRGRRPSEHPPGTLHSEPYHPSSHLQTLVPLGACSQVPCMQGPWPSHPACGMNISRKARPQNGRQDRITSTSANILQRYIRNDVVTLDLKQSEYPSLDLLKAYKDRVHCSKWKGQKQWKGDPALPGTSHSGPYHPSSQLQK